MKTKRYVFRKLESLLNVMGTEAYDYVYICCLDG